MDDEVAHQSDKRDFWSLAPSDEMLITVFQVGVVTTGDECGHVESFASQGSSAADKAFTLPAAALARVRSHSRQGGGLGPVEFSQFGHFRQETDQGFGSDADDLLERLSLGLQWRILLEQGFNLLLEF